MCTVISDDWPHSVFGFEILCVPYFEFLFYFHDFICSIHIACDFLCALICVVLNFPFCPFCLSLFSVGSTNRQNKKPFNL